MLTSVKITNVPIGGTSFDHHSKIGASFFGAFKASLSKSFRILANANYGSGNGRYMIGLGPQAVVAPNLAGTNIDVSLVHAGGALVGAEAQAGKNTQFGFYYGGFYFQRNAFQDTTSPLVTKPFIGFGGLNSPNSANRAIQEGSFEWTQTFWKNPQYGAVLLVTQTSYVTRSPWFVALGAPKNAHLMMGFVSVRYVLP
jgi:hypothetical protein